MDPYGTPMKAMATPPSWSPQRHAWQVNAHGKKTYLVQGTAGYLNTWNLWENRLKKQPGLITGLYETSFIGYFAGFQKSQKQIRGCIEHSSTEVFVEVV